MSRELNVGSASISGERTMIVRGSAALANAANNTACAKGLFELLRVDLAESWAGFAKAHAAAPLSSAQTAARKSSSVFAKAYVLLASSCVLNVLNVCFAVPPAPLAS